MRINPKATNNVFLYGAFGVGQGFIFHSTSFISAIGISLIALQ